MFRATISGEDVLVNKHKFDDFEGKWVVLECEQIDGQNVCKVKSNTST